MMKKKKKTDYLADSKAKHITKYRIAVVLFYNECLCLRGFLKEILFAKRKNN